MDIEQEIKEIVYHDPDVEKLMVLFRSQRSQLLKSLKEEITDMEKILPKFKKKKYEPKFDYKYLTEMMYEVYNQALIDVIKLVEEHETKSWMGKGIR